MPVCLFFSFFSKYVYKSLLMYNLDVRLKIKQNCLCNYEVAREIGVSEFTFCKWLREELNEERKNLVLSAIDKLIRGECNE